MRPSARSLLLVMIMLVPAAAVIPALQDEDRSTIGPVDAPFAPFEEEDLFSDLGGQNAPVYFENVSRQAGLDTFGGSYFAWGDYNDDGYQDLLVNGRRLLRNDGPPAFTFTDVTSDIGLARTSGVNVGIWGDYDNDGDLDVYLAGGGWSTSNPTRSDYLFRNEGAPKWGFTDVTAEAGNVVDDYPSVAAAWGDLDGDGHLDLYVANYETSDYQGYPDTLWHNDGLGHPVGGPRAWPWRRLL